MSKTNVRKLRGRTIHLPSTTEPKVRPKQTTTTQPPTTTNQQPISKTQALLQQLYLDPLEPTAYGSARNLWEAAKKHDSSISMKDVRKFLHALSFYTKLFPPQFRFDRRPIIAFSRGFHQIDLAALLGIRRHNRSYSYILVAIDTLSGMLYTEPVKKKTASETADAYRKILGRCKYKVRYAQCDEGGEFAGAFRNLLKSRGIRLFSSYNKTTKAALAERSIKTLKRRLYMYMMARRSYKWIDMLQKITNSINNTKNSVTKLKPIEVDETNEELAFIRRYHSGKHPPQATYSFNVGDLVRCLQNTGAFRRSFYASFSPIVYQITKRYPTRPHIYQIKDLNSTRPLLRRFYSKELVKSETTEADYTAPTKRKLNPMR